MEWWEILYLINVICIVISARIAVQSFKRGNDTSGWLNLFASALNAAIVAEHFL